MIDRKLTWKNYVQYAVGKGTRAALALKRLGKQSYGISPNYMRRLYLTVVVPKMLYAAECFVKPFLLFGEGDTQGKTKGSITIARRFRQVQRMMATAITGAMKTTSGDIAEVHANLQPTQSLMNNKICQRATMRIATLPENHPLHGPLKRTKKMVKKHPTQSHFLANHPGVKIQNLETISITRNHRKDTEIPNVDIIDDRNKTVTYHTNPKADVLIYTNGSAKDWTSRRSSNDA